MSNQVDNGKALKQQTALCYGAPSKPGGDQIARGTIRHDNPSVQPNSSSPSFPSLPNQKLSEDSKSSPCSCFVCVWKMRILEFFGKVDLRLRKFIRIDVKRVKFWVFEIRRGMRKWARKSVHCRRLNEHEFVHINKAGIGLCQNCDRFYATMNGVAHREVNAEKPTRAERRRIMKGMKANG